MGFISIVSVPLMICGIIAYGMIRKIDVYDSFVEGAKEGMESMFRIVPPLIGLIVAISMLRESGALELLGKFLKPITDFLNMPSDVLPLALLRPVSGSGSMAIVNDIFKVHGPDSIEGKIASVMMGSTETTFYTIAVYFGAVGIKKSRHTAMSALFADLTGIIMSVIIVRAFLP